ncbi:nucleotidyltransferase [Sulfodiicoccus acidiphilus]|uniref:Nucleotidyltransferase n=2 Tax=Sulfodiicoccus acidiphilus TaxID=1670455 RepID=A0A348B0Y5_9CREN|nr:NDP-sugar synthase [Sulfodiicoccus acidiphilus]BBD71837.1 nucleotidyltransferase [Sulfodiicoccus acidiphilus]GGU02372.1 nucleotidyltransferase [Sulfodiicoccus acidiphilus]
MDLSKMKVIIPIGGEGLRLRPLTIETSKATVRILNRPLLEFPILELARQGVKEFIFGVRGYVNYKSLFDNFKEGIGLSSRYKIKPRLHFKYQPRIDSVGNADSVRINMEYYDVNETTMVIQGDNLFHIDLKKFVEYHEQKKATMSILLKRLDSVEGFGVAVMEEDGRIKNFVEKPRPQQAPSNLVNTGIYLLSPDVKEIFKEKEVVKMRREGRMDFGKDFIPYLIETGRSVYGYQTDELWFDVGTPERYLEAMLTLLKTVPEEGFLGKKIDDDRRIFIQGQSPDSIRRRNYIRRKYKEKEIQLEGNILIGRHCHIGTGTYIEESVIDNFSVIRSEAKIIRSAVMDRVYIGEGASIENSIIGRHCEIRSTKDNPVRIVNSALGDDVVVEEGTVIIRSKVYPHKLINTSSRIEDSVIV